MLGVTLDKLEDTPVSLGIFLYTTYFTSVWVWLYAIAAFIVKGAYALGIPLKAITYIFDIAQRPILALGTVACLVVTFVFVIVYLWELVFSTAPLL